MSVLRKNVVPCIPDFDCIEHTFVDSRSVEEIVPVFDKNGKKVREFKQKSVERVEIPADVWENRGIKADLFSLENQLNSGVDVKPFNGSFIGIDLDESDRLGDDFISSFNKFVSESQETKNDVEPIK